MLGLKTDILWVPSIFATFGFPNSQIKNRPYDAKTPIMKKDGRINWHRVFKPFDGTYLRAKGGYGAPTSYLIIQGYDDHLAYGIKAKKIIIALASYAIMRKTRHIPLNSKTDFARMLVSQEPNTKQTKIRVNGSAILASIEILERLIGNRFFYFPSQQYEPELQKYVIGINEAIARARGPLPVTPHFIQGTEMMNMFRLTDGYKLWDQTDEPYINLSQEFYDLCIKTPVALSAKAVMGIRSPSCLDLYAWFCANHNRNDVKELKLHALYRQLGNVGDLNGFCKKFHENMLIVKALWPNGFKCKHRLAKSIGEDSFNYATFSFNPLPSPIEGYVKVSKSKGMPIEDTF